MPRQVNRKCIKCGTVDIYVETRDLDWLCWRCAIKWNCCEICGSMKENLEQDPDQQPHFEEECFK